MPRSNKGIQFDEVSDIWLKDSHIAVNMPAIVQTVKRMQTTQGKDLPSKIASLLRAVTCLDLTTLCGDDTSSNVERLCAKATEPINKNTLYSLGFDPSEISCAAVCVYPAKISKCVSTLALLGSSLPVAAVAAGFPCGQNPTLSKQSEVKYSMEDGAQEIDIVVNRELILCGKWEELYKEVSSLCSLRGPDTVFKTIISAGELGCFSNIYKASIICMAAGSDFIKTSTGKESVNATLPIGTVMARAIKDYYYETGNKVGFKAAGGIRNCKDVYLWQELMAKELGKEWLFPNLFRIGASSLLGDIEQVLGDFTSSISGNGSHPYF